MIRLREWWEGLGRNNQIVLVASCLGVLVAFVGFVAWASTPEYVPLFANLDPADANAITDKLKESNVPYRLSSGGKTVEVPAQFRDEQTMKLASAGLPAKGSATLGYEILRDVNGLQTQPMEAMQMKRAMEGEVSKRVTGLAQVASASVLYSPASDSAFLSDKLPAKASVFITLKPGQLLTDENTNAIRSITQMSFPGLIDKNISITDNQGHLLFDGERMGGIGTGERNKEQQRMEREKTVMLQALLDQRVGPHTAVAMNIELDTDETSIERHTSEPGAVLSTTDDKETLTGAGQIRPGAPGTNANVGGAPANTPLVGGNAAGIPSYVGTNDASGNYNRETTTTTRDASRIVENTKKTPGGIKKWTVSCMVDKNAKEVNPADIKQFLETAIGVTPNDQNRSVTVTQLAFDRSEEVKRQKEDEAARAAENTARMVSVAVPLALMLLCFFLLARALRKTPLPVTGGQLALAGAGGASIPLTDDGLPLALNEDGIPLPGQRVGGILTTKESGPIGLTTVASEPRTYEIIEETFDAHLESILQLARSKPEMVSALIKSWIVEEK